jgi:pimeloyl-ACP methyl ester carboxylesterase
MTPRGDLRGRRSRIAFLGFLALVVIGLSACALSDSPEPKASKATHKVDSAGHQDQQATTTTTAPGPPFRIQQATITLTDPSRATPARGVIAGHPGRSLVTVIRRPVGATGALPLVVFAHGWNSNPSVYEVLLDTWAEAGFLVAAPTFPDSTNTLPGSPVSNYPEQARDMSFVISSLLGGAEGPVDPSRIAVAGHSDGGTDIALLALNPNYADPRIRAYISMSGEIPSGVSGPWGVPTAGALLVAVGTADQYGLLGRATQIYQTAEMPKALLTLAGGDHLTTFIGTSAGEEALRAETVRFLNAAFSRPSVVSAQLQEALFPTGDPEINLQTGSG